MGGDGQFGRIGGMILRAGNGADAGYYGAVWDEARPVDVSRMITEEEWKLNKSGKNKKIANAACAPLISPIRIPIHLPSSS